MSYTELMNRTLQEQESCVRRRKAELDEMNLALSIADGLRASISATPDLFSRYQFSVQEAAEALAAWIARR
jgi:hypothetical protein